MENKKNYSYRTIDKPYKVGDTIAIKITKQNIQCLLDLGILDFDWEAALDTIYEVMRDAGICPHALKEFDYGLYLRAITKIVAKDFDAKYPDHISKAEKVYSINIYQGAIMEGIPAQYEYVSLFRTIEDAKAASKYIKGILDYESSTRV